MHVYDKKKVGQRIRNQREALQLSRENVAEQIGRVPSFCADIERGKVGMSIETMLALCHLLKLSPNDLLLPHDQHAEPHTDTELILAALNHCTDQQRQDALSLLRLFLKAIQ